MCQTILAIFQKFEEQSLMAKLISKTSFCITVWKFGNFPATKILSEINFCGSRVSKSSILTVSAPDLILGEFCSYSEAKLTNNQNSEPLRWSTPKFFGTTLWKNAEK